MFVNMFRAFRDIEHHVEGFLALVRGQPFNLGGHQSVYIECFKV